MRTEHFLSVAVFAASLLGTRLSGQNVPGTVVRVSHDAACCETPLTGTLLDATADSIRIRPGGTKNSAAPITLSRRSVQRFERGERVGAYAGVGAMAGFLVGSLAGRAIGTASMCHQCDGLGGVAQAEGFVLGGLVGILTGVIIGSHIPHYAWEQADLPQRVGVAPGLQGGMQVQVSLSY